jgi:argininosuccinate synthase
MSLAALAFSGGLDTSYAVLALRREGFDVVTVTVDTGGFSPEENAAIADRARSLGVLDHVSVDGRQAVYDRFFRYLIFGNVLRGRVYPVAVGAERFVQAEELARVARNRGCDAVAHGCTAAGNDQVRFDVALKALLPDLPILAPVRDREVARAESTRALQEAGVSIPAKTTRYSINAGLVGTTVGGGETHDPWETIPEEAYVEAGSRIDEGSPERVVVIGFERGLPVSLDGEPHDALELVAELDRRARPLGIGRGVHTGETVLGIKGRIGFVAPAATVLIRAHHELEKLVLTRRQATFKDQAGSLYGDLLHEGLHLDPVCRDLEALLESAQRYVTGEVRVHLKRGCFDVLGARSPHTLVREGAVYGEESALWSGEDTRGFARIFGLPSRLSQEREQEREQEGEA